MRILNWLLALMWLPCVAAATNIDLGDLAIPASRVPQWYPATAAEEKYHAAQGWTEYDATCPNAPCPSGRIGFRDAPGDPMSSCDAADPANNGGEDWDALNCQVSRAPEGTVIFVPNGTYEMGNASSEMIRISRDNVVIRGQSRTGTHLVATSHDGSNGRRGAANCSGGMSDCGSMIISVGGPYEGSSTRWRAGYEENATAVTVDSTAGLSVGGWILLDMTCAALLEEPTGPTDKSLSHIAKIVNISGSVVHIDRGLRMDYDDDGCQGSAIARPYTPRTGVGIENLHLTTDPSSLPQDLIGNGRTAFSMGGVVDSWAVGNHLERFEDEIIRFQFSARNWVQGNIIQDFCYDDSSGFNTEGVLLNRGAVDNVIENNYGTEYCLFSKMHGGPAGNVFGYNYLPHGDAIRRTERAFMNHGMYTREMLFEGNDLDHRLVIADHWWGPNGPRNTAYRNRLRGTGSHAGILTNRDKSGSWIIADQILILGNTAAYYYNSAENGNFPYELSASHDIDRYTTNMWLEKNIFRDTQTCEDDPTPNRCGFHMVTAEPTSQCGREPCSANGGDPGDNAGGNMSPAEWNGDVVPHSLYRDATPPSWWCLEACSWSDVHAGIGAWGDNFNGGLCKLPAQIMAEGGTCTPVGDAQSASRPAAPFLLE